MDPESQRLVEEFPHPPSYYKTINKTTKPPHLSASFRELNINDLYSHAYGGAFALDKLTYAKPLEEDDEDDIDYRLRLKRLSLFAITSNSM